MQHRRQDASSHASTEACICKNQCKKIECHQTLRIFERSSLSAVAVACGRHNGSSSGSGSSSGRDAAYAQRHGQQTTRRHSASAVKVEAHSTWTQPGTCMVFAYACNACRYHARAHAALSAGCKYLCTACAWYLHGICMASA